MVDSILQLSSSVLRDVIKLVIVIKIEMKFVFSLWQRPFMAFLFQKLLRLVAAHLLTLITNVLAKCYQVVT